jgi:hypothetical protein
LSSSYETFQCHFFVGELTEREVFTRQDYGTSADVHGTPKVLRTPEVLGAPEVLGTPDVTIGTKAEVDGGQSIEISLVNAQVHI